MNFESFSGVQSTSALPTQLFSLKLIEFSPVHIFRHSSLTFMLIMYPFFFNVVAGSALPGSFKSRAIIKISDFGNMQGRIKTFVDVAALTVLANYLIGLSRTKVPVKRFLNICICTSWKGYKDQGHQETLRCKNHYFPKKKFQGYKFLKYVHRNQTKLREVLRKYSIRGHPK